MTRTELILDEVARLLRSYAAVIDNSPVRSVRINVMIGEGGQVRASTIVPELGSKPRASDYRFEGEACQ